jgi:RHS repeat-associated protein
MVRSSVDNPDLTWKLPIGFVIPTVRWITTVHRQCLAVMGVIVGWMGKRKTTLRSVLLSCLTSRMHMGTNAIASRMLSLFLATAVVATSLRGFDRPYNPTDPKPAPAGSRPPKPDYTPPETLVPPAKPIIPAPGSTAYLSGGGSVTATGDYEYTLPLAMPMGRAAMQPSLALHYSSRRGDHVAGVGWSIAGLSVIHRCPKAFFIDGAADGVDLDYSDALCLDGKKLTLIKYGEYRTEREEFLRIVAQIRVDSSSTESHGAGAVSADDISIAKFTVYRRDGTIAEYLPDGTGVAWPIATVRDRAGNEIRYTYDKESPHSIQKIEFTTRAGDPTPGAYQVDFTYKTRSFALRGYVAGMATKQGDQLATIAVTGPNGPAWTYTLGYTGSPVTSRLLLKTVQSCAYGTCTQKRIFEYESAAPAWQLKEQVQEGPGVGVSKVQVLDFDGNGKDDIMYPSGTKVRIWRVSGLGSTDGNPPDPFFGINAFLDEYPVSVDIDGDGRDEVIAYDASSERWRLYRYVISAFDFAEDVTFPVVSLSSTAGYDEVKVKLRERPYFVDLNGDGLPEMVKHVLKDTGGSYAVAVTRVWSNVNGSFVQPKDYDDNEYFPPDDTLLPNPPEELVNYPPRLDVRVEDRYGDRRQALVQRAYPIGQNYANPYKSHYSKVLRRDDSGTLKVEVDDAPSDWPRADMDLDGDGLRDRLYFDGDSDIPTENVLAATETNVGAYPYKEGPKVAIDGGYAKADEMDWLVGDLDEDGKEDLVMAPRDTTVVNPYVKLAFSTEDEVTIDGKELQRLRAQALPLSIPGAGTYRTRAVRFGDFDADGRADLLVVLVQCSESSGATVACDAGVNESYFQIYTRQGSSPDQLVRVRDDGAARVREELTWMQWRKPDNGGMDDACSYPAECIKRGMPVVREHRVMNPSLPDGVMDSVFYLYDAPRAHIAGRGFLGFGIVRAWFPQRPMEVTTRYLTQSPEGGVYPYASSAGTVTTVTPILNVPPKGRGPADQPYEATARVVERASWYDWKYTAGAANWTRFRFAEIKEWEEEVKITWGDVYADHIRFDVGPGHKLPARSRTLTADWDDAGNVTKSTFVTNNGVKSQVENVYKYPSGAWPVTPLDKRWVRSARSVSDPWKTRTTKFVHNLKYQLIRVTHEPGGGAELEETLLMKRDAVTGLVDYIRHSAANQPSRWTFFLYDKTGAHVVYTGNGLGHARWREVWPELGVTTVMMDANGASAQLVHDGLGRSQAVLPEGEPSIEYDYFLEYLPGGLGGVVDNWVSSTGSQGYGTADELGRQRERCTTSFDDGAYSCLYTEYDTLGNVRTTTRPGSQHVGGNGSMVVDPISTLVTFDSLGRVLDRTIGDLPPAKYNHTFFTTAVIEPNGNAHGLERDLDDRITLVRDHAEPADPAITTTYTYAEFGELETVDVAGKSKIVLAHDKRGRLKTITDPDMGLTRYTYNGFGDRISEIDANLHETLWKYDAAGRVYERKDTDGTTKTTWDKALHGIGQVASTVNADGTIVTGHTYDALGRPAATTWGVDGQDKLMMSVVRDPDTGRVSYIEYPQVPGWPTLRIEPTYDSYDHVKAISARFVAQPLTDQVVELWRVDKRRLDGALLAGHLGNGVATQRTYDSVGRLQTLSWSKPGNDIDLEYGYDDSGNVTSRIDHAGSRTESFHYDGMARLRHWLLKDTSGKGDVKPLHTDYTYDELGNLRKVFRGTVAIEDNQYGAQGKPHALLHDGSGGLFHYDARGRLLDQPNRKLSYTAFDLPKTVKNPDNSWQLRYDAAGTRVIKTNGSENTLSIGRTYERWINGNDKKHTFRVSGTDGIVAEIVYDQSQDAPLIRYLAGDRNGSVTLVTDVQGDELAHSYFDPFGRRINSSGGNPTGSVTTVLGFGEHRYDDDMGFVDMTGRAYDAVHRRFVTPDPIIPQPFYGQSYNRYAYTFQNPVTLNDRDGHDPSADMPGMGLPFVPFGFIFDLIGSTGDDSAGGSGSGSPGGSRGGGGGSAPKTPPAPPTVRTNLEQYAAGWYQAKDSSPGCWQSKGGTAERECVGPGDQGCKIEVWSIHDRRGPDRFEPSGSWELVDNGREPIAPVGYHLGKAIDNAGLGGGGVGAPRTSAEVLQSAPDRVGRVGGRVSASTAEGSVSTSSGWSGDQGYTRSVMAAAASMDIALRATRMDWGVPGLWSASHAEPKLLQMTAPERFPGSHTTYFVNEVMCEGCRFFASNTAMREQVSFTFHDPRYTWIFTPSHTTRLPRMPVTAPPRLPPRVRR